MFLVASLGNPSPDYDGTRHNLGRVAVERWLNRHDTQPANIPGFSGKAFRIVSQNLPTTNYSQPTIVSPNLGTYMNETGPAIVAVLNFFKITAENLILVHDDLSFALGEIRLQKNISA